MQDERLERVFPAAAVDHAQHWRRGERHDLRGRAWRALHSERAARPGNVVTLPNQVVDTDGNITAPYAGKIRALGRTPSEVQEAINEALRGSRR
jgi:protein involved in polysaccharide export with SLBB domain